jgi:hypothetical protein
METTWKSALQNHHQTAQVFVKQPSSTYDSVGTAVSCLPMKLVMLILKNFHTRSVNIQWHGNIIVPTSP